MVNVSSPDYGDWSWRSFLWAEVHLKWWKRGSGKVLASDSTGDSPVGDRFVYYTMGRVYTVDQCKLAQVNGFFFESSLCLQTGCSIGLRLKFNRWTVFNHWTSMRTRIHALEASSMRMCDFNPNCFAEFDGTPRQSHVALSQTSNQAAS